MKKKKILSDKRQGLLSVMASIQRRWIIWKMTKWKLIQNWGKQTIFAVFVIFLLVITNLMAFFKLQFQIQALEIRLTGAIIRFIHLEFWYHDWSEYEAFAYIVPSFYIDLIDLIKFSAGSQDQSGNLSHSVSLSDACAQTDRQVGDDDDYHIENIGIGIRTASADWARHF